MTDSSKRDSAMEVEIQVPGVSIKPRINKENVKDLVKQMYGLKVVSVEELNGYDDKNFHIFVDKDVENSFIDSVCENGYVLKIINTIDSKKINFFDGQTKLLLYIGERGIKCPKPVKTKDNTYFSTQQLPSGKHVVRLLEFVSGNILHKVPCTSKLFYEVGQYIANLDIILKDFTHSAYETYDSLWTMKSIPKLSQFLYAVADDNRRKIAETTINNFQNRVLSITDSLEKGIIHGDFNEQNIIVKSNNGEWTISAVIDFGDSQFSCYLFELAIAMTYMMLQGKDIDVGGYVLTGYCSVRKLPVKEFELLKLCIESRLCQSLVLGAYSYMENPSNTYVLTTAQQGWAMLEKLTSEADENVLKRWREISENY